MYASVEKAVLAWFKSARNQNLPITGVLIKEMTLEFSLHHRKSNFKASTGWLDKLKNVVSEDVVNRIAMMLGVNMDGSEEFKLLVIG